MPAPPSPATANCGADTSGLRRYAAQSPPKTIRSVMRALLSCQGEELKHRRQATGHRSQGARAKAKAKQTTNDTKEARMQGIQGTLGPSEGNGQRWPRKNAKPTAKAKLALSCADGREMESELESQ